MKAKESFALLFLLSVLVFGQGVHWFITPHPNASHLRLWAVATQVTIALGLAVFSYRKLRKTSHTHRRSP